MTPQALQDRLDAIAARSRELMAVVNGGERDLTAEELTELEGMTVEQEGLLAQRRALEQASAMMAAHDAPTGRLTTPEGPQSTSRAGTASMHAAVPASQQVSPPRGFTQGMVTGGEPSYAVPGASGFRNIAEFGTAVYMACARGIVDERLPQPMRYDAQGNEIRMQQGQSIGVGIEGGYALPGPLAAVNAEKLIMPEDSLLPRTMGTMTSGNTVYMLVNEQAPWESGAVKAYWEGERTTHTESDAELGARVQRLAKLTVFVRVTEEALDDAPLLGSMLEQDSPAAITWAVNEALIAGDGVGKPLGFLEGPGLVVVPKETSQAANTVVAPNIVKMWGRMYAPHRNGAVWCMNQDVEEQLIRSFLPATTVAGDENVGGWPVYMPANGLSGNQFDTLYGREIIFLENMKALGQQGDILLCNWMQYQTIRKTDAVNMVMSVHLYFDSDQVAFKWRIRMDGAPKWRRAMPRANAGALPLSNHITLAERA